MGRGADALTGFIANPIVACATQPFEERSLTVAFATNNAERKDVDDVSPDGATDFTDVVSALRATLADDLASVDSEIVAAMNSQVELIPDLAGHLVNAGGKRLRPMLTLAAAHLFDGPDERAMKLAAAVELIHGATLLHDDVVDASSLRRGASTANVIWGNKESVLVGDYIFSRAFELMVAAGDLKVLDSLSRASGVIAEGEVMQLSTQHNLAATFETYLAVVTAKTAALFSAAAEAGAVIAGAGAAEADALKSYGLNLGVAYQLVDDALDYSGREAALGKRVGDDFREGKMSAPVVFALREAGAAQRSFWVRTIERGDQRDGDFEEACTLVAATDALDATFARARDYTAKAIDALRDAPPGPFRDALVRLAEASVERRY